MPNTLIWPMSWSAALLTMLRMRGCFCSAKIFKSPPCKAARIGVSPTPTPTSAELDISTEPINGPPPSSTAWRPVHASDRFPDRWRSRSARKKSPSRRKGCAGARTAAVRRRKLAGDKSGDKAISQSVKAGNSPRRIVSQMPLASTLTKSGRQKLQEKIARRVRHGKLSHARGRFDGSES